MSGHRGRNQWTGRMRCGQTMKSGERAGEPCGRIVAEMIGARLLCRIHAKQARNRMAGTVRAGSSEARDEVDPAGGCESGRPAAPKSKD